MGKKGSWLSAVKRAFRSPTKENNDKVRTSRRREDEQEQEEEEKREKRRWIFRKPSSSQEIVIQCQQLQPKTASSTAAIPISAATVTATEQRHNIAMAVATTAAAEAAVVKAQAAVEVLRLIRPTNFVREHGAALMIQKAFRGYLSRDGSSIPDDWDDRPHRVEEIQAMLNSRKEASLNREKALAYAFSHQIWKSGRNPSFGNDEELEETPKGLDRWMSTKPWDRVEGGRGHHFGIEQRSNFSSCCTDSIGGENSPSSTSDLRRWLR
ncbi:hypothetical protein GIB67_001649 [Kingdonia uniflora]|uniref:Uncharacterized protein n=1 Tax=Kingdonia uniflora TaxID=39325 RepID=A0A7J7L0S7_9MAGN|nr:hypothetical protein GIB67_001649 [Kingdonia uniflora]